MKAKVYFKYRNRYDVYTWDEAYIVLDMSDFIDAEIYQAACSGDDVRVCELASINERDMHVTHIVDA